MGCGGKDGEAEPDETDKDGRHLLSLSVSAYWRDSASRRRRFMLVQEQLFAVEVEPA